MARKLKSDRVLFFSTLLLVFASIVMVYSASAMLAQTRYSNPYLFLAKQVVWAVLGAFYLLLFFPVAMVIGRPLIERWRRPPPEEVPGAAG